MSPFGLVSREKYVELQTENEKLRRSLTETLDRLKRSRARVAELSENTETLSQRNEELTKEFHALLRERDQLQSKLEKYLEERQLLQKVIQELDSLAKKRRKKTRETLVYADSFESDVGRLLNQTPIKH